MLNPQKWTLRVEYTHIQVTIYIHRWTFEYGFHPQVALLSRPTTYSLRATIFEVKWGVKLPHDAITEVSKETGIHCNFLRTIWECKLKGERIVIRRSEGYKKRKHKTKDVINDKLTTISLLKIGTIRSLRKQLNIGVGLVHR